MRQQNFDRNLLQSDSGSAVIEFVGFGVLLQVPLLMFCLSVFDIQKQQLATESVANVALRSFVLNQGDESQTRVAIAQAIQDFGFSTSDASVSFIGACEPSTVITVTTKIKGQTATAKGFC